MTQVDLARKLGKTQALISRIESAGDLYISTMRKQIEALGGGKRRKQLNLKKIL